MGQLIEVTHVSLGGEVGNVDWAQPYLDEQHRRYAMAVLEEAEALLLGRITYEGLSAAYLSMAPDPFVERMNSIPKYVATTTLQNPQDLRWNATAIAGDVAGTVAHLKRRHTGNLVRYGNGPLDAPLMAERLIDEFHLLLTPVATGSGQHLFESVASAPQLQLKRVERFDSGVLLLVYTP